MFNSNTQKSPGKKRTGCVGFLSFCLILIIVLIAVSLIIGFIQGDTWGGVIGIYNRVVDGVTGIKNNLENSPTGIVKTPVITSALSPVTPTPGFNAKTGEYKNFYLGLVDTPEGVITGEDCYGEFIVLINNKDAHNPTYAELVNFLKTDTTDEYPYQISVSFSGVYYGDAEDQIDLANIKNIIDGVAKPEIPKICADFAERLHNNAEMAGIRCGYISLDSPNHALDVFETTDRGLVYIDDTGTFLYGPDNCDKVVTLKEGQEYIPVSLFPEPGWNDTWDSLGIVSGIFITWDGTWRN
jgi:hypothetical protein